MSKKLKFPNIITIDAYAQTSFKVNGKDIQNFSIQKPLGIKKENFYIAYIKQNRLKVGQIELAKTTKESELGELLTQKIYQEFNLDGMIEYKIAYIQAPSQSLQEHIFNVFITPDELINADFMGVANNTSCIDHIVPLPLLYGRLYASGALAKSDVDCFIRLENDDAFLTLYKDGELLTLRPLRYNLSFIKDKFCELTGERISEQSFFDELTKRGISSQNDEFSLNINSVLSEFFLYVNDVINSLKRIYNVEINFIFFDILCGQINGLNEFASQIIGIKCANLSVPNAKNNGFNNTHAMLALYATHIMEEGVNFSTFKRPEPLFKTPSGKLIIAATFGFLLSFSYPALNYIQALVLDIQTNNTKSEFDTLNTEILEFQAKMQQLKSEQNSTQTELLNQKEMLLKAQNLLNDITSKEFKEHSASLMLFNLTKQLNESEISLSFYSQDDSNITLNLLSNDEAKLTNFIHKISQNHYVIANQISSKNGIFDSNITIKD